MLLHDRSTLPGSAIINLSSLHCFQIQTQIQTLLNRFKAFSMLTNSTPLVQNRSFNKIWNLGQASAWLVNVGKSYLRKSYLVGLPESISHQEVPPQLSYYHNIQINNFILKAVLHHFQNWSGVEFFLARQALCAVLVVPLQTKSLQWSLFTGTCHLAKHHDTW